MHCGQRTPRSRLCAQRCPARHCCDRRILIPIHPRVQAVAGRRVVQSPALSAQYTPTGLDTHAAKRQRTDLGDAVEAAPPLMSELADMSEDVFTIFENSLFDNNLGKSLLAALRLAQSIVEALERKAVAPLAGLNAVKEVLHSQAIESLLQQEAVIESSVEWRALAAGVDHALQSVAFSELNAGERTAMHALLGHFRELRVSSTPAVLPTTPLVDFLFIVCSPHCAPLRHGIVEAQACAACVERVGMTALVLPECSGQRVGLVDLNRQMMLHKPRVVVFIGHTDAPYAYDGRQTFGLTDEAGNLELMNPTTVERVLERGSDRLELIFLNGCHSADSCSALTRRRRVASIGWSTRSADEAAKAVSIGITEALCQTMRMNGSGMRLTNNAVHSAFEHGKRSLLAIARIRISPLGTSDRWTFVNPQSSLCTHDGHLCDGTLAAGEVVLFLPPCLKGDVPALATHLVPMPEMVHSIQADLVEKCVVVHGAESAAGLVVSGMGGIGKTMLLACLVRDPATHGEICPDGALWVQFSKDADALTGLRQLTRLLASLSGFHRQSEPKSVLDAKEALVNLLQAQPRVLIVADDVWTVEQVRVINEVVKGSGHARLIVTSRRAGIVDELGASRFVMKLLQEDDAMKLMADWAGQTTGQLKSDPDAIRVASWCGVGKGKKGGLPLALRAVGLLANDFSWPQVWKLLAQGSHDIGPTDGRIDAEYHPYEEQYAALFGALRASLDDLPVDTRDRCLMLGIFMEDDCIPFSILERCWCIDSAAVLRLVALLAKRSMIIEGGAREGYIRLHDLQRDFLHREAGTAQLAVWHADLLRRCGTTDIGDRPSVSSDYWATSWPGYWGRKRFAHHAQLADFGGADANYGDLAHLESLNLFGCASLTNLPPALMAGLIGLQDLCLGACTSLVSVALPHGLSRIEEEAFADCISLRAIELPESIIEIGERAFDGCSSLATINLPGGLQQVGDGAFSGCSSLSVAIEASICKRNSAAVDCDFGVTALLAVQGNAHMHEHSTAQLRADRRFILAAVNENGCALRYASVELRADREIVLAAVNNKGYALE